MLRQKGSVLQMTAVLCIPKQTEDTLTRGGEKKKKGKYLSGARRLGLIDFVAALYTGKSKISDDKRGILNDVI